MWSKSNYNAFINSLTLYTKQQQNQWQRCSADRCRVLSTEVNSTSHLHASGHFTLILGYELNILLKTIRPKLKINLFLLTRPTCQNRPTEIFLLEICRHFFPPFRSKFRILDSFHQKIDIFALPSTSLSSKKTKTYLPTHFQNCGSGKGKQKYF